ncbi:MAG: hypothetical protein LC659_12215 [Myxococcales bacterium]|nr:hypothetical protein [Myxococcales bacterium]
MTPRLPADSPNVAAQLAQCGDGASYCVPDPFIKSGGTSSVNCDSTCGMTT